MVAKWVESRSRAARIARGMSVFALLLAAVAAVSHRFGLIATETFLGSLGVVLVLALLSLLFAAFGFSRMWRHGDLVGTDLVTTAFVLGIVLAPFGWMAFRGATTPMLHDVATDVADPPSLISTGTRDALRNPVGPISPDAATRQRAAYPEVTGRRYALEASRVRSLVTGLVTERGWTIVKPFGQVPFGMPATLNAEAASFLLGFPADIAVRVADEGDSSFVDMRSAGRYGEHDFGDNALRIERFFADLDAALLAQNLAVLPQAGQ